MLCPSCQTKNQFFNNYCYYCGQNLKENDDTGQKAQNDPDEQHSFDLETSLDLEIIDSSQGVEEESNSPDPAAELTEDSHLDNPYDYMFKNDDFFSDEDSLEFDLSTQIPLRRYHKDKPSNKLKIFLKTLISIVSLVLAILAIFILVRLVGRRTSPPASLSQSIAVSSSVEETTKDGETAYRVIFNTVNGKEIRFLGEVLAVENGRAEFIIKDSQLYSYSPEPTEDGSYEVNIDATISAPNLPDSMEELVITLSPPYTYAPFTLLQPSTSDIEFQGEKSKVSFKIQPGSKVSINDQDFSDLVSSDGRFEKEFNLPSQQDELVLDIRVSTPGCLDNIQQIIIRKANMDVPLTINETSPITSDEQWIKISGTTHPEATLESDHDIFEEPKIDSETGDFELYIKASQPGYTPCTLIAKFEGKESSTEIILDRKTSVDTYTSTAWKPDYDKLQQDDQLSNGRHFVFSGNIKDIIETGNKNIFTVSLSDQSDSDQLFYVEYWGSFDYNSDDKIRVFGNRWGNKNGIPRFLAKYIYE